MEEVELLSFYLQSTDQRGSLNGIINSGSWEEVNIVHTRGKQLRGGHYHRLTTEIIFLLSGSANVELRPLAEGSAATAITLAPGQGITIKPYVVHWVHYHTDSTHIQLLDRKFDPCKQDLIRFEKDQQ